MRAKALVTFTDFESQKKSAMLDIAGTLTPNEIESAIKSELNWVGLHNFGANLAIPVHVTVMEDNRNIVFNRVLFNGSILLK